MTERCKTQTLKKVVPEIKTKELYNYLKNNIDWEESIKSKRDKENGGFTRWGCLIEVEDHPIVYDTVLKVIDKIEKSKSHKGYIIESVYLNYYENGKMWSPNHTHAGLHSLVISLGATRNFVLGKKVLDFED